MNDVYDLKGYSFNVNVEDFSIDDCTMEIKAIRNATEKSVTSISNYYRYFSAAETNKISQRLKIKNLIELDKALSERQFNDVVNIFKKIKEFRKYIMHDCDLRNVIEEQLFDELTTVIDKIIFELKKQSKSRLIDFECISMFNSLINLFVTEISRKTGQPPKPVKTGFYEYASNRIRIKINAKKVLENINKSISPILIPVGDLGIKGKLFCQTNLVIQNGNFVNSQYSPVNKVNKTPQKEVAKKISIILRNIYSNELFEKIAELNNIENGITITNIKDLLLFNRHFSLNSQEYHPSNGESSMILLHNELKEEKEIYLIDEPEKSLGNDYINDMIVPLLKERAQMGKKIIIATHDANIAVRTLPYNSIYREHDINEYLTYMGNPFSNNMVCIEKRKKDIDWKNISMKTLEGGKEAFGERGKIYGTI